MAEVIEITGKVLFEIRDEIKESNRRLGNVDTRLKNVEDDIAGMRQDIKAIHGFLQRDIVDLANRVSKIEQRLEMNS